jgi:GxxExxY protein
MTDEFLHEDLSRKIIGAAITVLTHLKPGLDERLYENALVIELQAQGHRADQQHRYPVLYRDQLIGTLIPDLIVEKTIIVDAKVVTAFHDEHIAQMLGYLAITGLELALLLNFRYSKLQIKRVARSHPPLSA